MKKALNNIQVVGLLTILFLFGFCNSNRQTLCFDNLEESKVAAKNRNTEIFIIFDVFGSPTKVVDILLADNEVITSLEKYVVVRLKCDDKKIINDSLSVGKLNASLQSKLTGGGYQPMFCFLNNEGNLISSPLGYAKKEDILEYIKKQTLQ